MTEETALKAERINWDLRTARQHLKSIETHSFGFGTSFHDIDDTLRPICKQYLESRIEILLNQLENLS